MSIISRSDTDFFLTGGTALSRAYYNHRYSDDLDFFVNRCQTFDEQIDIVLAMLTESGLSWDTREGYTRAERFLSFNVRKDDVLLKLDFVNDSVPLFGKITQTDLFYRTDSIRNILSNKLSAIFRYAAKDIADIREIALNEDIEWSEIIKEARQKDAGMELTYVSQILASIPQSEFEKIAWVKKTSWNEFHEDVKRIAYDMLHG